MKLKVNKKKYLNSYLKISCVLYLFLVMIIAQIFPAIRYVRYILIPLLFLLYIVYLLSNDINLSEIAFIKVLKQFVILSCLMVIVSVALMIVKNVFNLAFVNECLFTLLPVFFACMLVSFPDKNHIRFLVDCFLYFTIINFLIRYISILSISGIISVSFKESFSPYESELVNIFLPLTFFYLFVDKNLIKALVSGVLCWLSMKRIHELFLIIYFVVFALINNTKFARQMYEKKYSKKFEFIIIVLLCLFPIVLVYALSTPILNELSLKYLGISFNAFMMGREEMYKQILEMRDIIAGWGGSRDLSLILFGTNDMHSDILRIYIETTLIGLVAFNFVNVRILERRWICLFYYGFVIVVMLVSPIVTDIVGMSCIYLILFSLQLDKGHNDVKERLLNKQKNNKHKRDRFLKFFQKI